MYLCNRAETECMELLECGILTREQLLEGWTETTYIENYPKILSIFEKFQGKLIFDNSVKEQSK